MISGDAFLFTHRNITSADIIKYKSNTFWVLNIIMEKAIHIHDNVTDFILIHISKEPQ